MKTIVISATTLFACVFGAYPTSAAEMSVLSVAAVKDVLEELIPAFEKGSAHKVTVTWTGSADIRKRIVAGETYDLVVTSAQDVDEFIKDGKMVVGSRTDLMKVGVGIAVGANQPKPDVSTSDALKRALVEAKAIGYSTGASGTYIETMFKRLGVADAIKGKLKQSPSGVAVGTLLASGDVSIGFQQISELIHYLGITFVGPLPKELQNITIYSAALQTGSKQPDAAKALSKAISSPTAIPLIKDQGMEPPDVPL